MKEVEIMNYRSPIHCMMCGTQTTDGQGSSTPCPHLVYLGMSEGVEFSICEPVEEPDDDDEWGEYDAQIDEFRKDLDDEHLCIHVTTPAPSCETYSIVYNLGVNTQRDSISRNKNWEGQASGHGELSGSGIPSERKHIEGMKELRRVMGDEDFKKALGPTADTFLSSDSKCYDADTLDEMR